MQNTQSVSIYRIKLADGACRSALALFALRAASLDGARALTVKSANEIVFVAKAGVDSFDEVVEVLIRAGLDPIDASVSVLECRPDKRPVRATPLQRASVHVNGGYDPDTIILSARVPAEINFSEGHGCLEKVVFDSLGIEAGLEHDGAVISLPALEPGTYPFRCGRNVARGTLIAE